MLNTYIQRFAFIPHYSQSGTCTQALIHARALHYAYVHTPHKHKHTHTPFTLHTLSHTLTQPLTRTHPSFLTLALSSLNGLGSGSTFLPTLRTTSCSDTRTISPQTISPSHSSRRPVRGGTKPFLSAVSTSPTVMGSMQTPDVSDSTGAFDSWRGRRRLSTRLQRQHWRKRTMTRTLGVLL